jgi:hypothetical protein
VVARRSGRHQEEEASMTGWVDAVLQWPLSVSVTALVALSALVSWLATRAVRRIWPHPAFKDSHELAGFTYAVYGLIYGVLLACTIVVAWQRFAGPSSSSCTRRRCSASCGATRSWPGRSCATTSRRT